MEVKLMIDELLWRDRFDGLVRVMDGKFRRYMDLDIGVKNCIRFSMGVANAYDLYDRDNYKDSMVMMEKYWVRNKCGPDDYLYQWKMTLLLETEQTI
jgi:hypothetical protein